MAAVSRAAEPGRGEAGSSPSERSKQIWRHRLYVEGDVGAADDVLARLSGVVPDTDPYRWFADAHVADESGTRR